MNTVVDNTVQHRYELHTDAGLAFIDYQRAGGVVSMTHASVPPALHGRGIGSQLVKGALELARAQHEKVRPVCPFVVIYLQRHPEFHDLLTPGA